MCKLISTLSPLFICNPGNKYETGLKELEAKRDGEKWSDNKFKKKVLELGNKCCGSRGTTPLTDLLKSPLNLLLDSLHMRNSLLKICFQVIHQVHYFLRLPDALFFTCVYCRCVKTMAYSSWCELQRLRVCDHFSRIHRCSMPSTQISTRLTATFCVIFSESRRPCSCRSLQITAVSTSNSGT